MDYGVLVGGVSVALHAASGQYEVVRKASFGVSKGIWNLTNLFEVGKSMIKTGSVIGGSSSAT